MHRSAPPGHGRDRSGRYTPPQVDILVVTAWSPWGDDGNSIILGHQLPRLADRHRLTIFSASPADGAGPLPVRSFSRSWPAAVDYLLRRGRGLLAGEPAHVYWVERRRLRSVLRRQLAEQRPDLLYLFGWGTSRLARLAPGIPTVHFAIDPWSDALGNRLLPRWRRITDAGTRRLVAGHEARWYLRTGAVVVVAAEDADRLAQRAPGARVVVVPNGVDLGPEPTPPPVGPVVGFHGNFTVEANVEAARALVSVVLPALRARMPDTRVILVGRDPPAEVVDLAGPAVTVTGAVPDVRPWLEQMAVYLAPMTHGVGLKNKVLEAMAAGRPAVVTPLGLQGIGAGDGVVSADLPELAEVTLELLADPARAAAIGAAGRARVRRDFTWDQSTATLEQLFEEVVAAASVA